MIREYFHINDSDGNLLMYSDDEGSSGSSWSEMPSDAEQFDELSDAREVLMDVQKYNPKAHIERITISIEEVV